MLFNGWHKLVISDSKHFPRFSILRWIFRLPSKSQNGSQLQVPAEGDHFKTLGSHALAGLAGIEKMCCAISKNPRWQKAVRVFFCVFRWHVAECLCYAYKLYVWPFFLFCVGGIFGEHRNCGICMNAAFPQIRLPKVWIKGNRVNNLQPRKMNLSPETRRDRSKRKAAYFPIIFEGLCCLSGEHLVKIDGADTNM